MNARYLLAALVVAASITLPAVWGDTLTGPRTFTRNSPDGRFLLVMIAPTSVEEDVAGLKPMYARRVREIRSTYPTSGMYEMGRADPLWIAESYVPEAIVIDENLVVGYKQLVWRKTDEVIAFYDKGTLLHSYRMLDVMDFPVFAPRSVGGTLGWVSDIGHSGTEVTLQTVHLERLTFNAASGELMAAERPIRTLLGVLVSILLVGLGVAIVWSARRNRRV